MVTTQKGRSGWVRPFTQGPPHQLLFARSRDDAVIAGVAGGLGERWGVDPVVVRIAFVVLALAGAIGVIVYIAAWMVALDPGDRRSPKAIGSEPRRVIAFSLMALGVVVVLKSAGLWLGEGLFFPIVISAVGAGFVSSGAGTRLGFGRDASGRPQLVHLLIGLALVVGGVTRFLVTNRSVGGIYAVILAIAVTTLGLAIVFGPWVFRMTNQLGAERRERIRSEERSELAAHLHDSVLQTLALIQRNAGDPRKMASLARRQERELRAWLYGQSELAEGIEAAVHQMADAIEEAHGVTIEIVVVGECVVDEHTMAVVHACREAANNAARHSGVGDISVYLECEPHLVTAYVRDRGKGFDPEDLPQGRRGIADSIRGRIERHGGSVTITSAPHEGCEVQILMPIHGGSA